jgi:hypothetical protein
MATPLPLGRVGLRHKQQFALRLDQSCDALWVDRARLLCLATGAQMATHSSWDLGALQPVFRTGNELRSADLRMSKEVESGPGFTLDRSWFANPDRSNEHNSRVPKTEPPSAP